MRIALISTGSLTADPRAIAEAESLRLAGHEVVGVSPGEHEPDWVRTVPKPVFADRVKRQNRGDRLATVAAALDCEIYQPTSPKAIDIAAAAASSRPTTSILVRPTWPRPTRQDLIALAPREPKRTRPASDYMPVLHTPGYSRPPKAKRRGVVVIAYRRTDRNPGRYIQAALERAGLEVRQTETIDWSSIDPSTLAVVVVESPLPALAVKGENPGVPVAFWVHHGEHHLDANLRLQRRYGASLVLLAHSWHLSHRFTGLVDRLPFGVPTELFSEHFVPHVKRSWDVGFVGAVSPLEDRYQQRQQTIAAIEERLGPGRVKAISGVPPEEISGIYAHSRIVVDDGAGRHLPITMRVFEATAAGALLITNVAPGMELLYEPQRAYVPTQSDVATQVEQLLKHGTESTGHNGYDHAWENHTYDIRVDELLGAVDRLSDLEIDANEETPTPEGLGAIIDRFADVQRVLDLGGEVDRSLPGREVWQYDAAEQRAEPGTFQMSVIAGGSVDQRRRAVAAARLGVVSPSDEAASIEGLVGETHGYAERFDLGSGTVFTFGGTGYRVSNDPDPL